MTYQREYEYAQQYPDKPVCKALLELAQIYRAFPESATLGLIHEAIIDLRKVMAKEARQ